MPTISAWGTANAILANPAGAVTASAWGTATALLVNPYTTGAIPSVYDQTSQTWRTVEPMLWDEALQVWKPQ